MIAGPPEQVDAVIAAVTAQDRLARRVELEVASHTALMDPILPELRIGLADLTPKTPTIPFLSTVADTEASADVRRRATGSANVRQPVRFSQAIAAAAEEHATFVEVSPHPTADLCHQRHAGVGTHHHSIGTLQRDTDDTLTFHTNLNTTHTTIPRAPRTHPNRTRCYPPPPGTTPATGSRGTTATRVAEASLCSGRRHGSNERHPRVGKHTRSGCPLAR